MNRAIFYDDIRQTIFRGRMSKSQVDGMNNLLDVWRRYYINQPQEFLSYMLATAFHETAHTMRPLREYGRGRGRRYGRRDPQTRKTYYGRGYVQLTWKNNYKKAGNKLGHDFVNNPDLVMGQALAAQILYAGSIEGWFTGKKLSDYIKPGRDPDYVNARRIINGTDRNRLIAGYAEAFDEALTKAKEADPVMIADSYQPPTTEKQISTTNIAALASTAAATTGAAAETWNNVQWVVGGVPVVVILWVMVAVIGGLSAYIIWERFGKKYWAGV